MTQPDSCCRPSTRSPKTWRSTASAAAAGHKGVPPLPVEDARDTRLVVDRTRCQGHGLCAHLVPELVKLDRHGFPVFMDTGVPSWLLGEAQKAVEKCPALALRIGGA